MRKKILLNGSCRYHASALLGTPSSDVGRRPGEPRLKPLPGEQGHSFSYRGFVGSEDIGGGCDLRFEGEDITEDRSQEAKRKGQGVRVLAWN